MLLGQDTGETTRDRPRGLGAEWVAVARAGEHPTYYWNASTGEERWGSRRKALDDRGATKAEVNDNDRGAGHVDSGHEGGAGSLTDTRCGKRHAQPTAKSAARDSHKTSAGSETEKRAGLAEETKAEAKAEDEQGNCG